MRDGAFCRVVTYAFLFSALVGGSLRAESGKQDCSEKFVGTVVRVSKSEAPFSSSNSRSKTNKKTEKLKKLDIKFKVAHSENGAFTPVRSVKFEPTFQDVNFREGASYRVQVDGNEVCHAKFIAVR